ncbi:Short-chain dehydrogenase with variable specificity (plasmid) [Marinovum algicola DG 898]|nr:Short-chain dehydrogenase with variable specificity [Marinovum algicola DG 898]
MTKTILITGATDGLGNATATHLAKQGHALLLHGRNVKKLAITAEELRALPGVGVIGTVRGDLSDLDDVAKMAEGLLAEQGGIDVLINNAGVLKADLATTARGEDLRFVVNTFAPALLSRRLLPAIPAEGRLVHLSSAAQAPVDLAAMAGERPLEAMEAYAQSKLALTMWSAALARELGPDGPVTVAVNPGSLLATKMVKQGFGVAGNDIGIGADILSRAALSADFAKASGLYFDNDSGRFAAPHSAAADKTKAAAVVAAIEKRIAEYL